MEDTLEAKEIDEKTESVDESIDADETAKDTDEIGDASKFDKVMLVISRIAQIAAAISVIVLILSTLYVKVCINGSSMEPTLLSGDIYIIDRPYMWINGIDRYDIVVCRSNVLGGEYIVKRVIGLPGESVKINSDGTIEINNSLISDGYSGDNYTYPGIAYKPISLSDNEYFVLGDNRDISLDSRYTEVGNIKKEDIIGILRIKEK